MIDEIDQHPDADECEEDCGAQREVRHEGTLTLVAHGAQNHQRERKGSEKGTECDLHAAVARKIAEQSRTHLPGRERERGDRDREDGTGDADRRRSNHSEPRASVAR